VGCGCCATAHATFVGVTEKTYDEALPELVVAWHRPSAGTDRRRLPHVLLVYALKVPLVHVADGVPHVHVPHPPGLTEVPVV
jgi:hypothetical protein